ncbi:hypothetical protein SESBI_22543 [Sesbania bispinosa]|nr:hypothetical protein SESBI_22543 [Sesbania bispinosa]
MNLRDLMLKAKAIGVDGPKGKESKKRKITDGSASTHSGSQSLPPPQPTVESAKNVVAPVGGGSQKVDIEKKGEEVPPKDDAGRVGSDGGSSGGTPVLGRLLP